MNMLAQMRLDKLIDRPDRYENIDGAVDIRGLTSDSRDVEPGFLFAALPS